MVFFSDKKYKHRQLSGKAVSVIFALMLLIILFSITIMPLMDPSEGRYGSIGRMMFESGNYTTPQIIINGKIVPFWGKPPLFFWMQACAMRIFGVNEFSARLPSALSAWLLLLVIYFVVKRYKDPTTALHAVMLTFTAGGYFFVGNLTLLDMLLVFTCSSAYMFYYAFLQEKNRRMKKFFSLLVFGFLGLGMLTKGPVALVMFGLPVFFWHLINKKWAVLKDHAWVTGLLLFSVLTVPWYILAERATPGFLNYFFVHENFLRFLSKHYGDKYGTGHRFPYGMSILFFLLISLPWVLFPFYFLFGALRKKRKYNFRTLKTAFYAISSDAASDNENKPYLDYFFIGFVSVTIFWCFARQLLAYYLLPALPPFAVWLALLIKKRGISIDFTVKTALTFCMIYLLSLFIIGSILGKKKTTKIVMEEIASRNSGKKVVFFLKTPKSSYFYAGKNLKIQPEKNVMEHLSELRKGKVFLISNKKYLKRIPEIVRKNYDFHQCRGGYWYIITPSWKRNKNQ